MNWIGTALVYSLLISIGALVYAYARRSWATPLGLLLLSCTVAVFAARLTHDGPYAFPWGSDLASAVMCLVAGGLLVVIGRAPDTRPSRPARLLLAVAPYVLVAGILSTLHEIVEVAELRTTDAEGTVLETRLWPVDYLGATWVVTGVGSRHVLRLEANPRVELLRGGVARCYLAHPMYDEETVQAVLLARANKYIYERIGRAIAQDRLIRDDMEGYAVAIRLDPCRAEETGVPPSTDPSQGRLHEDAQRRRD